MTQSKCIRWDLFFLTGLFFFLYVFRIVPPLYSIIPFLMLALGTSVSSPELRVPVFFLFIVWVYAFAGNSIPQQVFHQASVDTVERTPEAFIKAGKLIFNGKGRCSTCHSIGPSKKARCPDLLKASTEAGTRKPGMTAREYIIESIYSPSVFIVPGYPKMMPVIWKPPIGLTPLEIETVVAYVVSLSGREVDVSPIVPPVDIGGIEKSSSRNDQLIQGDSQAGKIIFESGKGKCLACHKLFEKGGMGVEGDTSGIGPDLSEVASMNTLAYLKESILKPNAKIVKGYEMVDFRTRTNVRVEGVLLHETGKTLKVQSENGVATYKKDDIQVRNLRSAKDRKHPAQRGYFWLQAELGEQAIVQGKIVAVDSEQIIVKGSSGKEFIIQRGDVRSVKGKRIRRTSKMPAYAPVLTVQEFNDLLAYLQTLNGKQ